MRFALYSLIFIKIGLKKARLEIARPFRFHLFGRVKVAKFDANAIYIAPPHQILAALLVHRTIINRKKIIQLQPAVFIIAKSVLFYDIFYDLTLKIRPKFSPFCCSNEYRRKSINKRAYHRAENRI